MKFLFIIVKDYFEYDDFLNIYICLTYPFLSSMLNVQTKLHRATSCLEFFTTHEWRFPNDNAQRLWRSLSEQDRAQFPFDVTGLDWTKYLECYALGTRRYIMKEDDSTLPKARVHLQR